MGKVRWAYSRERKACAKAHDRTGLDIFIEVARKQKLARVKGDVGDHKDLIQSSMRSSWMILKKEGYNLILLGLDK